MSRKRRRRFCETTAETARRRRESEAPRPRQTSSDRGVFMEDEEGGVLVPFPALPRREGNWSGGAATSKMDGKPAVARFSKQKFQ